VGHSDQKLTRSNIERLAAELSTGTSGAPVLILYGPLADIADDTA
jgi:hypothetical protein